MLQHASAVVKERGQAYEFRNVGNLNRHSYSFYNLNKENGIMLSGRLTVWVLNTLTLSSTDKHLA